MALLNGNAGTRDRSISPAQHLGKRKRTVSPGPEHGESAVISATQQSLADAIRVIKRHDPTSVILNFPLLNRGDDVRTIKRQRTETPDRESDTIQTRISRKSYKSIDDLVNDMKDIKNALTLESTQENGFPASITEARQQIGIVWEHLARFRSELSSTASPTPSAPRNDAKSKAELPAPSPNQVLSLRSQTETGVRQLFSGLPRGTDLVDIDGRRLPNGFELTQILTNDKNDLQGKDAQKFGDVFAPHRSIKPLDMPRTSRNPRENTLSFIPPYEMITNTNRNDFKFASLSTGLWLKYAIADKPKSEASGKDTTDAASGNALFKGAFSSFAPTTDNSRAMVTDFDRSQQWWTKNGRITAKEILTSLHEQAWMPPQTDDDGNVSDKDLEEMVANFIPEEDASQEGGDVLDEISEMIETLVSYQSMRSLEVAKGPSSASKPSKDEQITYELLHNQLQLVVSSLPPYAVSKLNGQQLEELNISTRMLVSTPEFVGIGQVDDYTIRRSRAAQTASSAAGRSTVAVPNRVAYGTPTSAYNAQARAYNSMPGSAYGARPPAMATYSTPRPAIPTPVGPYGQSQYRPNGPTIHTPSIQQFQRPVINGFVPTPTPAPQTPYMQRSAQPALPQRVQDNAVYGQALKAATNGDITHSQQRPYVVANSYPAAGPSASAGQHKVAEDPTKLQQTPNLAQTPLEIPDGIVSASS